MSEKGRETRWESPRNSYGESPTKDAEWFPINGHGIDGLEPIKEDWNYPTISNRKERVVCEKCSNTTILHLTSASVGFSSEIQVNGTFMVLDFKFDCNHCDNSIIISMVTGYDITEVIK